MGMDATVMCRCLADGKVVLPRFAKRVIVDEEGFLGLDLPPEEKTGLQMRFYQWMANACEHQRMIYVHAHVGNWTSYRSFQQALRKSGIQNFPVLQAELPNSNGGLTSAAAAEKMLSELDYFAQSAELGWATDLVDSATGDRLHEYIESYDGTFEYGADGTDKGIDPHGFFILKRNKVGAAEIFRSMRFTQKIISNPVAPNGPGVEFVDLESGSTVRCANPILRFVTWPDGGIQNENGQFNVQHPQELHLASRKVTAKDHEYVAGNLRKICEAAVETGNPIRWG
jgi:hypothetical protein